MGACGATGAMESLAHEMALSSALQAALLARAAMPFFPPVQPVQPEVTNTLQIMLPAISVDAAHTLVRSFGPVASFSWESRDVFATVVYYDVRSAAVAADALGVTCCRLADSGDRQVRVPGDVEFDLSDCAGIQALYSQQGASNSYIVEFFDLRDAALCRRRLLEHKLPLDVRGPPGLEPPAFLDLSAAQEEERAKEESRTPRRLLVSGLPNAILSDVMMEAVLDQAGLGGVKDYALTVADPVGEAVITFKSEADANKALAHFRGCQWDPTGTTVSAKLLPATKSKRRKNAKKKQVPVEDVKEKVAVSPSMLSADAPAFVPRQLRLSDELPCPTKAKSASETSTDLGDSEEDPSPSASPFESPALSCWPVGPGQYLKQSMHAAAGWPLAQLDHRQW